jgi:hypothetical protein
MTRTSQDLAYAILGSVTAWLQSILGNVGAHSVFAYLHICGVQQWEDMGLIQSMGLYKLGG